jgi:hypothetical protein
VFGDTFKEDETIGKSAPFLYFTMKKILTVLISCFLCICSIHAEVTWKLDGRTLTISGSGDMDKVASYDKVNVISAWIVQKENIQRKISVKTFFMITKIKGRRLSDSLVLILRLRPSNLCADKCTEKPMP